MVYNPRDPRRPGHSSITIGFPRVSPYVRLLIIVNVVVWFVQVVSRGFGFEWAVLLGLVPDQVIRGYIWQPFTYMFLHEPQLIFHLLFNMVFLWMLGGDLERAWGSKPFLRYYLTCGVGAGIFSLVLGLLSGAPASGSATIGASGAIFGLVAAFGIVFGDRTILFMMMFPMKARMFAWIMFGVAFFSTWNSTGSNVSHIAHLGGAVTGFLYLKRAWRLGPFISGLRWRLKRRRFRVLDRDDDYKFH